MQIVLVIVTLISHTIWFLWCLFHDSSFFCSVYVENAVDIKDINFPLQSCFSKRYYECYEIRLTGFSNLKKDATNLSGKVILLVLELLNESESDAVLVSFVLLAI